MKTINDKIRKIKTRRWRKQFQAKIYEVQKMIDRSKELIQEGKTDTDEYKMLEKRMDEGELFLFKDILEQLHKTVAANKRASQE